MKTILTFIALTFGMCLATGAYGQASCCPDFTIRIDQDNCPTKDHSDPNGGSTAPGGSRGSMCQNGTYTFFATPGAGGFFYYWSISGGVIVSTVANQVTVTWGSGPTGTITLFVTNADSSCSQTITRTVSLRPGPKAQFTLWPGHTICLGTGVQFYNTSIGGSTIIWNFGDGSPQVIDVNNPYHPYATLGPHIITLTVTSSPDTSAPKQGLHDSATCSCTSIYYDTITVVNGQSLQIQDMGCKKMLCAGDTGHYCSNITCTTYNWSVVGGTIITPSPSTQKCIDVIWNPAPNSPQPVVALSVPAACTGSCSNVDTLVVPVLYAGIPITGSTVVCIGTSSYYSIPTLPGTFMHWTITPTAGANIVTADSNNEFINVAWTAAGNYSIVCTYSNPLTGCSGSSTLLVHVRPVFAIGGMQQSCATCSGGYYTLDGSTAVWSVDSNGTPIPSLSTTGPSMSITFPNLSTTTIYTVTATAPSGYCNATATITTTVYPLPILSTITGPSPICPGGTQSYTVTSNTTGIPINWQVTMSNGGSGGTVVGSGPDNTTGQVTFTPGDTLYIITATQACQGGCAFATMRDTVRMIPPPGPITGPTPACMDVVATYSISNPVAGSTYTWVITPSGAGTITGGQGTGTVQILWHGSNGGPQPTITVSNCAGSSPPYAVTVVTVYPVTIQQTGSICTGVTLTAVTAGTVTGYNWSNGPTGSSITVTTPGTYTVIVHESGCDVSASVTLVANPLSVTIAPTQTNFCPNQTISSILQTLVSPSAVGVTYSWSPGGQTTSTITALAAGTYTVTATLGTCTASASVTILHNAICDSCGNCPLGIGSVVINTPANNAIVCNPGTFNATYIPGGYGMWPISWNFGDLGVGSTTSGQNISHTYANIGVYHVTATVVVTCGTPPHQCSVTKDIWITIPSVTHFDTVVGCTSVQLIDHSLALSSDPLVSWNWSASPSVTFLPSNTTQSPSFVGVPGQTYTVTLTTTTASGCVTSETKTITIPNVPPPVFSIPSSTCSGAPVFPTLTAIPGATYHWDFGDGYTSNLPPPALPPVEHAFINNTGLPVVRTVTLVVTYGNGCKDSSTHLITVNPVPHATVAPNPTSICPGTTVTLTATVTGGPVTYAWYETGNMTSLGNLSTYVADHYGHFYVIVTNTSTGCSNPSDTAVVLLKQAPIAKIVGSSAMCYGGPNPPSLQNIGYFQSGYTYSWSSSAPAVISFNPAVSNTQNSTQLTFNSPTNISYQVYLAVTDGATGCTSYDTLCVFPSATPTGSISVISGTLCAGSNNVFCAVMTPPPSPSIHYYYQWSDGETGDTITTSIAGLYTVTVTNMLTGCSVTLGPVIVNPLTDLSLFPIGCLTICNTQPIGVPLPLITSMQNVGFYTVQWFDGTNPTPIYTGWQLPALTLSLGLHHLHIKAVGPMPNNGCPAVAGNFDVTIIPCNCNCEGHKITGLQYAIGAGSYQPTKCGGELPTLGCDSLHITANFNCDSGCTKKFWATLDSGGVIVQTWPTLPVAYLPTPGTVGMYTIHLYGKCDEVICDSCELTIQINCPKHEPPPCDICPPDFKKKLSISVAPQPLILDSIGGSHVNNLPVSVTFNTGSLQLTEVEAQVASYELTPSYADCMTCDNKPAGWTSITGQPLAGVAPFNGGIQLLHPTMPNQFMNPREVVWQSSTPFTLNPATTTLNIYLPALANVPCCLLTGKICIRFSFRDVNCKVCDTLICFDFGKPTDIGCNCGKWTGISFGTGIANPSRTAIVTSPTSPTKPVPCDGTYNVAAGTTVNFTTGFACTDPTCTPVYQWTLSGPKGPISHGAGPNGSIPNIPNGTYTLNYSVMCGGKDCPGCSVTIHAGR